MALRTTEFDDDIEKVDNIAALCDDDNDWTDSAQDLPSHISSETLVMTCHNIISQWHEQELTIAQQFPAFKTPWSYCADLQEHNLSSLDISSFPSYESSGLRTFSEKSPPAKLDA